MYRKDLEFRIQITLSHLVSKNEKFLLRGKLDDCLDVFSGEDLTSGVAGVDDDDNLDVALVLGGVV